MFSHVNVLSSLTIIILIFYHPYPWISSSFSILIFYHPHPLSYLSFIILILQHPHPLSSSSFLILILYHRYPLSSSSFIILVLYHSHRPHHAHNPHHYQYQARCAGPARRGRNRTRDLSTGIFWRARAPNNARPPGKILRLGQFQQRPPQTRAPENCPVGKHRSPKFSARWIQHKFNFARNFGFYRVSLKKFLNFRQKGLFQKAEIFWNFHQNGEGVAHAYVFLGSKSAFEIPRSLLIPCQKFTTLVVSLSLHK